MSRLAIQFWVDAYMRRAERAGAYPAIIRKGNAQEGALTLLVQHADGQVDVYEPALNMISADERRWSLTKSISTYDDRMAFQERLARQYSRDPDMWVIEITSRSGEHYLEVDEII